ncbi:hypothetical protein BD289DRAFT_482158 [Coniella lustricola]|uniref:DnaJ-like protein C11 C-terminal domain-containing protein n=1 Tax=Coniella lustricola TaxID=2025994 RepID=A0A2T3A9V6_9PEZI|nr:hypothetical protein BD289DRAFT_482158 [Coniella lustricola]
MTDGQYLQPHPHPQPPPLPYRDDNTIPGPSPLPVMMQLNTAKSGEQLYHVYYQQQQQQQQQQPQLQQNLHQQQQCPALSAVSGPPYYRYNASLRSVRSVASRISLLDQFATTRKEFEFDFDDGSSFVALSVYGGEAEGDDEVNVDVQMEMESEDEETEEDEAESEGSEADDESDEAAGDKEVVDDQDENIQGGADIEAQENEEGDRGSGDDQNDLDDAWQKHDEMGSDNKTTNEQDNTLFSADDGSSSRSVVFQPSSSPTTPRTQSFLTNPRNKGSKASSRTSTKASTKARRIKNSKPAKRIRRKHHELLCLPLNSNSAASVERAYSRLENILCSPDMPEEYAALAKEYFEDVQKAFEAVKCGTAAAAQGDEDAVQDNGGNANHSTISPNLASTCVRLLFWTAYVPAMGLAAVENVLSLTFSTRLAPTRTDATKEPNGLTTMTKRPNPKDKEETTAVRCQTTTRSHRKRIEARRAEADNLVTLLAQPVRHRQRLERERGGLVILSAKYGVVAASSSSSAWPLSTAFATPTPAAPVTANAASSFLFFGSDALSPQPSSQLATPPLPPFLGPEWPDPEEVADVTVAVAALVDDESEQQDAPATDQKGSLYIPRGLRKSKLLGFWDPQPGRTKCLMVKYVYEGREGVELVMGREELRLP